MKCITLFAALPTLAVAFEGSRNSQQCNQAALGRYAARCNDVSFVKQPRQAGDNPTGSSAVLEVSVAGTIITIPSGTLTLTFGTVKDKPDADPTSSFPSDEVTNTETDVSMTGGTTTVRTPGLSPSVTTELTVTATSTSTFTRLTPRATQADTVTITASEQFTSLVGTSVGGDAVPSGPVVVTISTSTVSSPGPYSLDPTFISYSTTTLPASTTTTVTGPTTSVGALIDPRPGGFTIIDGIPYAEWTSRNPGAFLTYTLDQGQGTTLGPDSSGVGTNTVTTTTTTTEGSGGPLTTIFSQATSAAGSLGTAASDAVNSVTATAAAAQITALAGPAAMLLLAGLGFA